MPTKLIGLRISEDIFKELEKIAISQNITTNQIAKKAVYEWLDIIINSRNQNMIIIEKALLNKVLEDIEEDLLEEIAIDSAKKFLDFAHLQLDLLKEDFKIEEFLQFLIKKLGKNGLMWLDSLNYEIKREDHISIKGTHSFNLNYSKLLMSVISYLMEELFNYIIIGDWGHVSESTIGLEFLEFWSNLDEFPKLLVQYPKLLLRYSDKEMNKEEFKIFLDKLKQNQDEIPEKIMDQMLSNLAEHFKSAAEYLKEVKKAREEKIKEEKVKKEKPKEEEDIEEKISKLEKEDFKEIVKEAAKEVIKDVEKE
ncbi:MAG: hypothetical protein HWN67_07665 [Candidatus Helarchaeota archaeon]|nr:hypothetical protein [Candidatus Helarchaeota archaeon]